MEKLGGDTTIGFCDAYEDWCCCNGHKFEWHYNYYHPEQAGRPDRCPECGSRVIKRLPSMDFEKFLDEFKRRFKVSLTLPKRKGVQSSSVEKEKS